MGNMVAVAPVLTEEGKALLIRAISGEKIVFTKFKIGNGETTEEGVEKLNDLVNPIVEFGINEFDNSQAGYVIVSGMFDGTSITTDFRWRELGVFCKIEDEDEVLFGYCNDANDAGILKANSTDRTIEQTVAFVIAIGDAQNVTALLSESMVYVSKTEFEDHLTAENPHGIDAETVGLGEVPNVSTNDQAPTYTVPSEAAELASGEKLSLAFGKIAAAVKSMLSHIKATGNVHKLTAEDINAAKDTHEHSAADINSGTLSIKRGGTGADSAKGARKNIGALGTDGSDVMTGSLKFDIDDTDYECAISQLDGDMHIINDIDRANNYYIRLLLTKDGKIMYAQNLPNKGYSSGEVYSPINKPTAVDIGAIPSWHITPEAKNGNSYDLDDVLNTGFYRVSNNAANTPVAATEGDLLMVIPWDAYTVMQIYMVPADTKFYVRAKTYGQGWHSWDTELFTNKGGTLTGFLNMENFDSYYAIKKGRKINDKKHYLTLGVAANGSTTLEHYTEGDLDARMELLCENSKPRLNIYSSFDSSASQIFGEHNKPTQTYNGLSSYQTISLGGIGKVAMVISPDVINHNTTYRYIAFVTDTGAICLEMVYGGISCVESSNGTKFENGTLTLNTTHSGLNMSGYTYTVQVL